MSEQHYRTLQRHRLIDALDLKLFTTSMWPATVGETLAIALPLTLTAFTPSDVGDCLVRFD
jgi:hypothetical protein